MSRIGIVVGIVLILIAVVAIPISTVLYYESKVYPLDKAHNWVDLAASSNNLTEQLADINASIAIYAGYHGNPNPLFPQPETNFDTLRQQMQDTVNAGLKYVSICAHPSNGSNGYACQTETHNIQADLTTTLESQMGETSGALFFWGFGWTDCLSPPAFLAGLFALLVSKER